MRTYPFLQKQPVLHRVLQDSVRASHFSSQVRPQSVYSSCLLHLGSGSGLGGSILVLERKKSYPHALQQTPSPFDTSFTIFSRYTGPTRSQPGITVGAITAPVSDSHTVSLSGPATPEEIGTGNRTGRKARVKDLVLPATTMVVLYEFNGFHGFCRVVHIDHVYWNRRGIKHRRYYRENTQLNYLPVYGQFRVLQRHFAASQRNCDGPGRCRSTPPR